MPKNNPKMAGNTPEMAENSPKMAENTPRMSESSDDPGDDRPLSPANPKKRRRNRENAARSAPFRGKNSAKFGENPSKSDRNSSKNDRNPSKSDRNSSKNDRNPSKSDRDSTKSDPNAPQDDADPPRLGRVFARSLPRLALAAARAAEGALGAGSGAHLRGRWRTLGLRAQEKSADSELFWASYRYFWVFFVTFLSFFFSSQDKK
jgi:hypothetical protein